MKTTCLQYILGIVFGFALLSPFSFQAQAALGGACDKSKDCDGFACNVSKDNPKTPGFEGVCTGPCTSNDECSSMKNALGWSGFKCTGSKEIPEVKGSCRSSGDWCKNWDSDNPEAPGICDAGVAECIGGNAKILETKGTCLEAPREGNALKDEALAKTGEDLLNLVDTITNWVFAIFVVLSIIFVLLAAFQFISSGGNAVKIDEARKKLIWATVGVIVALLAKGIIPVIRAIVGG